MVLNHSLFVADGIPWFVVCVEGQIGCVSFRDIGHGVSDDTGLAAMVKRPFKIAAVDHQAKWVFETSRNSMPATVDRAQVS